MATSNSYNFSLTNAEIVQSAYSLIQVRRPELLAENLIDARVQLNLMLSSWSNMQVNLFNVELVSVPLIQGTAVYTVDSKVVMILDAYISFNNSDTSDRLIFPISRTEFASYPDKVAQGVSSVFWYDRTLTPTVTLWLVPDQTSTYTLNYYAVTQNQDANLPNGEMPAVPYRWLDAMVSGLAARLAKIYKPELAQAMKLEAKEAWDIAATQDVENVDLVVAPQLENYYR